MQESLIPKDWHLSTLKNLYSQLTESMAAVYMEAAMVCLENERHYQMATFHVYGDYTHHGILLWDNVTDQMRATYKQPKQTTEFGAYGITLLLLHYLTGYTILEISDLGTGIDFWLGDEGDLLFQNKARLEVSGIRKGDQGSIDARMNKKIDQTHKSDNTELPAIVLIVEFSIPCAKVVKKNEYTE